MRLTQDWKQVALADVCNFQNGFAFKNSDYVEYGNGSCEIFRMGNILRGGGFNAEGKKAFVPSEQAQKLRRFLLNVGDILMCMTDMKSSMALLGHTARMPVSGRYLVNQRVGRITVKSPELLDALYLYYYSNSPDYIDWLRGHANSGVQVNLSTEAILKSPISLPPLPIQQRIAGILSAYDELIENSQRRIQILESMARALYREWFVHFRFPGHENHPRVESSLGEIPQGWEAVAFTEIADVLSGGTPKTGTPEFWDGEIPFFTPRDAPDCFYVQDTDKHVTELGLSKCASQHYPPDTVFITARGTVGKVALPSVPMAMNQSCYALRGKLGISQRFLFLMTLHQVEYLKTNTGGATFDTIVVDTFRRMQVVKPPTNLIAAFTDYIDGVIEQVNTLQRQIRNLRNTRDLLLPRLLSGQIDVEAA